jgi:vitamin B12 transporter
VTGGVRHDDYSTYGGHTTLGGNLAWSLNGGATVLRATYAEGFRAPTLTEGQPPYGNPALKPETARNLDLGIEQALLGDQVRFGVTWFNRRSTNLIVFSWDTFQSENIGKVDTDGLEVALQVRPNHRLQFAANYTLTNAINQSGAYLGKRLQLRPQHSGNASVDWETPLGLTLGASLFLAGDSFDDQANLVPLDGYALVTLRASMPLSDRLELYGRIENLTDAQYQTVAGYGTYGRAAYGGVRAKW